MDAHDMEGHVSIRYSLQPRWEDLPCRELPDSEGLHVDLPDAPQLHSPDVVRGLENATRYIIVCGLGIRIAEMIAPSLHRLALQVVRQDLHRLVAPVQDHLQQAAKIAIVENDTRRDDLDTTLWDLTIAFEALDHATLDTQLGSNWIAWNIYEIVFAAIASKTTPGPQFGQLISGPLCAVWDAFRKEAHRLFPNCIAFELKSCLPASTFAKYPGNRIIERFAKRVRDRRMQPEIQSMLRTARSRLCNSDKDSSSPTGTENKLKGLVQHTFPHVADWGRWWTVSPRKMEYKEQCYTCRNLWSDVALVQPNAIDMVFDEGVLDPEYPCQCAETGLASSILDMINELHRRLNAFLRQAY